MNRILSIILATLLAGCTGSSFSLPIPRTNIIEGTDYDVIGQYEADASGYLILGFIPVVTNSKNERAYHKLLEESGGDAIMHLSLREGWKWTPIMTISTIEMAGLAIKYKSK